MTELILTSDIHVELVRAMASDEIAVQTAQVSVKGFNKPDTVPERLIDSLVRHRHGVPFEHSVFTIYAEVPIFVARQWVKHRMSSINEMSGRYMQLLPKFYVPSSERPMINKGTKMDPKMEKATHLQTSTVYNLTKEVASTAWKAYETQLKLGIAEEMARAVLPVGIYTQFLFTVNARSLMNFLERRVDSPDARVPSHPQWEIEQAAIDLENIFAEHMPLTHKAFVKAGRVAP